MELYLLPAYGRRYSNFADAFSDWQAGKDFKISGGPYCSIRDTEKMKADGFTTGVLFGLVNERPFRFVL